jgi:O-antigen/teichoic acid export membrane protein
MRSFKGNFLLKNILLLFSGTGISQLVPFIATLFLSRLYTKTDFGDLALVMSIAGIVGTVVALRYDLIIILQKKASRAKTAMSLCFSLITLIGFLTFVFLILFRSTLVNSLEISSYSLLYSIPLIAGSTGVFYVFENWFNRQRAYKNMAYIKIAQSSTSAIAKLALGFAGISWGLVGGTVIGYVITVFICLFLFVQKDTFSLKYFSVNRMKQMAVSYQDFAKYSMPSGLLNSLSLMGLPVLIVYFYSTETAGIYYFANMLIGIPIFFLSNAMSQVFKKEAVILLQKGNLQELNALVQKFQQWIFLIVFVFILVFSLFGADIFSFVFGSQWYESGQLIKFFAFFLMIRTSFSIVSSLTDILRKQKVELIYNGSLFLLQILVFCVFSHYLTFEYTLLINSILSCIPVFVIDRYIKNKIKVR